MDRGLEIIRVVWGDLAWQNGTSQPGGEQTISVQSAVACSYAGQALGSMPRPACATQYTNIYVLFRWGGYVLFTILVVLNIQNAVEIFLLYLSFIQKYHQHLAGKLPPNAGRGGPLCCQLAPAGKRNVLPALALFLP